MNQILDSKEIEVTEVPISSEKKLVSKKTRFLILFFFSIIICVFSIIIYFFGQSIASKNEKISKALANHFSITSLYANEDSKENTISNGYLAIKLEQEKNADPFVIGVIKIEKINLLYPILSQTTEESLKISPCRYAGPLPNQVGNLCIAGHNYVDNKLFSKVHTLKQGDLIKIYDLSGNFVDYSVSSLTEVAVNDLSCTNQNTNGKKWVTLITCNNVMGTRVIVKADEV